MTLLFALLAFLAGAGLALQAGANAQLSKAIGNPFVATAIQLAIAAVLLLAGLSSGAQRLRSRDWGPRPGGT